jgi:hypothetical protein
MAILNYLGTSSPDYIFTIKVVCAIKTDFLYEFPTFIFIGHIIYFFLFHMTLI